MSAPIIRAAGRFWHVRVADILGKRRTPALVQIRAACAYVLVFRDGVSRARAGKLLGDRDHTTVLNLLANVDKYRERNEGFGRFVDFHMAQPKYCREEKAPELPAVEEVVIKTKRIRPPAKLPPEDEARIAKLTPKVPQFERIIIGQGCKPITVDDEGMEIIERRAISAIRRGSRMLALAIKQARMEAAA